jgi:hypothetical protein
VAGPDWNGETPAGIGKVFRSSTPFGLTIFRTQLFNSEDLPNVLKVQSGYKTEPLSAFLNQPAPAAAPAIDFVPANTDGIYGNDAIEATYPMTRVDVDGDTLDALLHCGQQYAQSGLRRLADAQSRPAFQHMPPEFPASGQGISLRISDTLKPRGKTKKPQI